jgi:hypothetical protein
VYALNRLRIEVSTSIEADPADIYAILADYRTSRSAILPRQYFPKLILASGGQGAGTYLEVHVDVYGMKRVLRPRVSEPEPGRLLVESDENTGWRTTYRVDPINGSNQSLVTITTDSPTIPGLQGFLERMILGFFLRRAHRKTLELLAEYSGRGL